MFFIIVDECSGYREKKEKRAEDLKKAFEAGGRILPNNFEAEQ